MDYLISSREYLSRARSRLDEGTLAALFYAAFELRCGIESRMSEYLEVWDHISKKKKRGWKIAELGRNIEEHFKIGNKIMRWAITDMESRELIVCLYYTPVTPWLRKAGEKLGNYLHSMKKFHKDGDLFWIKFREELEDIYSQLAVANKGTLLGPPLMKPGTKQYDMKLELPSSVDLETLFNKIQNKGKEVRVSVSYHTHLPEALEVEEHALEIAS